MGRIFHILRKHCNLRILHAHTIYEITTMFLKKKRNTYFSTHFQISLDDFHFAIDHLFTIIKNIIFYYSELQCSPNFCCTSKWLSYTYIYYIYSFLHIILHPAPSQVIRCSSLLRTLRSHCLSTPNIIACNNLFL